MEEDTVEPLISSCQDSANRAKRVVHNDNFVLVGCLFALHGALRKHGSTYTYLTGRVHSAAQL